MAEILGALDAEFLLRANCYFGGGTQIVLANGEYRESRDIDFMCSSRDGFRILREAVNETSLGAIFRRKMTLARSIRADRDGIRTFIAGDPAVKFEIVYEARIDVTGAMDDEKGLRQGLRVLRAFLSTVEKTKPPARKTGKSGT